MNTPVLFEMDPIGRNGAMEANGRIYYFCSDSCRAAFPLNYDVSSGTDDDWIDGTVCDQCGAKLAR